jgi:hypothetical protein
MGMASEFEAGIRRQIAEVEERRYQLSSELARIDGRLAGLREALALYLGDAHSGIRERGYSAREGSKGTRSPDPAKSKGWAFVLSLLEKAPPSGFSVDEIGEQVAQAGHRMARNSLLANLSGAYKEGIIDRVRVGYYRRQRGEGAQQPQRDTEQKEAPSHGPEEDTTAVPQDMLWPKAS